MTTRAATSAASKGEATRERIVGRALVLAGQLGLEGLTIGALADDLGLSKSGLFAHFKSKERLQLAVLEAAAEDFRASVFAPSLAERRGEPRLVAIFEHWLEWMRAKENRGGCVFLAGALEWDDREGPVRDALVHWFRELGAGLEKAVRLAIDAGDFRADLASKAFAFDMHGIVLKYHLDARLVRDAGAESQAHRAFDSLLQNARPRAS